MIPSSQLSERSVSSHFDSANPTAQQHNRSTGASTGNRVDIGHVQPDPTKAERASAFLAGTAVGMRGAVRGFVLAPSAFIVQTTLSTANVLLEGVTDALFQVAKKGGLKEISNGKTNFSALLQHNVEHERTELAENKPYGYYLANDAKADFQRAQTLYNREGGPAAFDIKTIDVGKNEAGGNKGIIPLNPEIKAHFSNHNQNKPFQLGEVQRSSEQRVLHFLKHSGLATVDLLKATARGGLAIGIAGIQIGKALGIGLASSVVDISFAVLKKGGLQELLKRESNIGEVLRHNFERSFQQIADKPYALILGQDAMHDLYSLVTNLKSAVAFDAPASATPDNRHTTPEQSANDSVVTPAAQNSEARTAATPPPIEIAPASLGTIAFSAAGSANRTTPAQQKSTPAQSANHPEIQFDNRSQSSVSELSLPQGVDDDNDQYVEISVKESLNDSSSQYTEISVEEDVENLENNLQAASTNSHATSKNITTKSI